MMKGIHLDPHVLGEQLRKFRQREGLSVTDVAGLMMCNPQTVYGHEQGKHLPPAEILLRYALIYGVQVEKLTRGATK